MELMKDGNPTDVGIRAMKLIVHAIYPNSPDAWVEGWLSSHPLLISLDAWRPLWERMDIPLKEIYDDKLWKTYRAQGMCFFWELDCYDHLEAALRTLEATCPDCEGTGKKGTMPCQCIRGCDDVVDIKCTCNDGKITLYELLEREVKS